MLPGPPTGGDSTISVSQVRSTLPRAARLSVCNGDISLAVEIYEGGLWREQHDATPSLSTWTFWPLELIIPRAVAAHLYYSYHGLKSLEVANPYGHDRATSDIDRREAISAESPADQPQRQMTAVLSES